MTGILSQLIGIKHYNMDRIQWIKDQVSPTEKIVDIGSNGGHTFGGCDFKDNVTNVDIDLHDIWNFVRADAAELPFKDKEYDVAVLAEILEHVKDPIKVLKEAKRVAKRVVLTVPDEYKWHESVKPFHPIEKWEEKGVNRADEARKSNPSVKEFYTEDNYAHLWHVRFYKKEELLSDIKKAGFRTVKIEEMGDENFAWFFINAK